MQEGEPFSEEATHFTKELVLQREVGARGAGAGAGGANCLTKGLRADAAGGGFPWHRNCHIHVSPSVPAAGFGSGHSQGDAGAAVSVLCARGGREPCATAGHGTLVPQEWCFVLEANA